MKEGHYCWLTNTKIHDDTIEEYDAVDEVIFFLIRGFKFDF